MEKKLLTVVCSTVVACPDDWPDEVLLDQALDGICQDIGKILACNGELAADEAKIEEATDRYYPKYICDDDGLRRLEGWHAEDLAEEIEAAQ